MPLTQVLSGHTMCLKSRYIILKSIILVFLDNKITHWLHNKIQSNSAQCMTIKKS